MLKRYINPDRSNWDEICQRPQVEEKEIQPLIAEIFKSVKSNGDAALVEYCKMFEATVPSQFKLEGAEIEDLAKSVPGNLKEAILNAKNNIWQFHEAQRKEVKIIETQTGVACWQKQVPIESVGIYVPGGSAPLFSTVLMLAVPAVCAGVKNINLFTPPNKEGSIHPAIAYAAKVVGLTNIYTVGGAQAIAAAAIGTDQIPKCDKIFGPGNQYVTAAKMYAQQLGVAIDMPAGPSEVLVWADVLAEPKFVASDLLSQAEHGPDSQCVLVCTDTDWASLVEKEIEKQLKNLPRKVIAENALKNSFVVIFEKENTDNYSNSLAFCNVYAPEHLIINRAETEAVLSGIKNAGSVFIGPYSPESVGDYASGTNHTLPTAGFAKAYSGVTLGSFCKEITFQKVTRQGLSGLADTVICMAENEGLQAHAEAVKVRLES